MGSKKGKSEEDHVSNLSAPLKPVWARLRKRLAEYPGTCFGVTQAYISWRLQVKGSQNRFVICAIYFQKKNLRLNIRRGLEKGDGKKSEGFFCLDGSKGMAEEQVSNLESGDTEQEYRIRLNDPEKIGCVISLLEQKYKSMA